MTKENNASGRRSEATSNPAKARSRPRGRPQKDSENPTIEQKRARVRRAQQAYRTRKEEHVTQLEEKCHELEGIVEDMTNTFIAFSDTLLNSEGVGLEMTKQLRETMKKLLVLSETAADHAEEATPSLDENNEPPAADLVFKESGSLSETINDAYPPQDLSNVSSLFQFNPILLHTEIATQTPVTYGTNIMDFAIPSPFANYGVWGIRPQHSRGSSIIPYVVAGRDSFASRLFYGSIVRGLRSLRGEGPPEDAYRIFRYKYRYLNPAQIQTILDGVLDMLLHGTRTTKWRRWRRVESWGGYYVGD